MKNMTEKFAFLALAMTASLALGACRKPAVTPEAQPAVASGVITVADQALKDGAVAVRAAELTTRTSTLQAPAVLAVDESRTARIGALSEGVVVDVAVDVGQAVGSGAALARVHSHIVHDAWAAYRTAAAERRRRDAQAALARQDESRGERLLAAKAIASQELARLRVERIAADEALDMAGAELQRASEDLHLLGLAGEDTAPVRRGEYVVVRTPQAGVLLDRLVTPGTAVTPGTPMFVVADLASLWAIAEIDEAHLPQLAVGRRADMTVSAYPGERIPITIAFIGQVVNPQTRRVTVRGVVDNKDGRLKPQMFASVQLPIEDARQVLAIPAEAVQELDGERVVFVETSAGRFVPRTVVTGPEEAGSVEIRRGITAGERIAVKGAFLLKSQAAGAAPPEN